MESTANYSNESTDSGGETPEEVPELLRFSGTESNDEEFGDAGYDQEEEALDSSDSCEDKEYSEFPRDIRKSMARLFQPNQVGDVVVLGSDSDDDEDACEPPFRCKVPGCRSKKKATLRGNFVVNYHRMHSGDDPLVCDDCFMKSVKSITRAFDFRLHKISDSPNSGKGQVDVINICEDDEQDTSGPLDNDELLVLYKNIDESIKAIDTENQVKSKFDEATLKLESRIDKLTVATNELLCKLDMEDQDMVKCLQNFYHDFRPPLQETDAVLDAQLPRQMKKHEVCTEECIAWTNFSFDKCKGRNPLIIPLLFGFKRVDHCPKSNLSKSVYYESPCGRLLTDFDDLLAYLHMTRSKLSVDLFNFDPWVEICDEFRPSPEFIVTKDLSNGVENTPISVVNSLDSEKPPYMEYITKRRPTEGVPLNTDPSFLTGCDCEDDCMDRLKCSCWQRTIQDYFDLLVSPDIPNRELAADYQSIGYQNRRLLEGVTSGIYECNSTCKCASTCLNRVVQHPLSVKLELFKTKLKGWGTRCLNDIPAGGFVCVYVGKILNEQTANEGGMKYGDEYFAELDYIEVMEQQKRGYESGPSNPESEDEDYFHGMADESSSSSEATPKSFGISIPTKEKSFKSLREYFGKNETVYIMDAKASGNIGRYLNHSCAPNIFVQNVFVDTHDLRFPWVAFFAKRHIRAGTELTWDYQYGVDTVPGKVMYCHCGSVNCRGRLL